MKQINIRKEILLNIIKWNFNKNLMIAKYINKYLQMMNFKVSIKDLEQRVFNLLNLIIKNKTFKIHFKVKNNIMMKRIHLNK